MKGDQKWLAQVGCLTRYFGKKGRKRSLAMCYECHAGIAGIPYEDLKGESLKGESLKGEQERRAGKET